MTASQIEVVAALIAVFALVNLPFLLHLTSKRTTSMPVIPSFQPLIDELNATVTAVTALKAELANAPAAQDLTDTQAALQAAADALKTAAGG